LGCEFYESTVGKKVTVAATGVILFGFVVLHMLGNLKAFMGIDSASGLYHLDIYAKALREIASDFVGQTTILWATRVVLLAALALHLVTVLQLQARNLSARPVPYAKHELSAATYASRSMLWGGLFLLIFIVFHLLHLTTGTLHYQGFVEGKVYSNVYTAFRVPSIVLFYSAAMLALGFHLYHGVWSLFQTFGFDNPKCNQKYRVFAALAAVVVALGFISVPISVACGLLPAPSGFVQVGRR